PEACILAADTVVALNNETFGKPKDAREAYEMLEQLQGKWHVVLTGIAVLDKESRKGGVVETRVRMRSIDSDEIQAYVDSGEPMGKAGAYAIQGLGAGLVEKIEGCFYNVVGL